MDIFTQYSLEFISRHIVLKDTKVLEVGCGSGELGLALEESGVLLTAIDTDEEAICRAKEKSINAKNIDFLDFDGEPFDVILFTRSLHHIHELEAALIKGKQLLKIGGKLLVEEFAVENINYKTARWYYDTLSLFSISTLSDEFFDDVEDVLESWEESHRSHPPLNTGTLMTNEIRKIFGDVHIEQSAYLFRHICNSINDDALRDKITMQLLKQEGRLVANELVLPVGIRLVSERIA